MANVQRGGLRWVKNRYAPKTTEPPIEILPVADSYATALYNGDLVKLISDGTIQAASAGDIPYGVFVGAEQYFDGSVLRKGGSLPASTTSGSKPERESRARVIPVRGQVFEVSADDATTATTLAGFEAFVGENCEWIAGTASGDTSGTLLDISTHNTTNTLSLRIIDIPNKSLQDFASAYVKLHVIANLQQDTASGSTTGT